MTESVSEEKTVATITATPSTEKIAERNTIVYETRIEPNVIEAIGEKIKTLLFTRFGFMKPKPEEIQLISIDKYYEPYMTISGKYTIDYYRKCTYTVKVDNRVQEVILANQKYKPNQQTDTPTKDHNIIKIQGEERITTEAKASLILDKYGQEINPKDLPSAPPEPNPKEILTAYRVKEIAADIDLNIIQHKILERPKDINRLNNELFEINERAIIYTPRYRALYTNLKTGEIKAIEFDGITAQRIQRPHLHP
ncbi:hypothetical protein HXY32_06410 [Candidatus Bathyarchaeota archaeon]|nr:hypothetical protein [Candidatus Bathyarchaeota archaeon]